MKLVLNLHPVTFSGGKPSRSSKTADEIRALEALLAKPDSDFFSSPNEHSQEKQDPGGLKRLFSKGVRGEKLDQFTQDRQLMKIMDALAVKLNKGDFKLLAYRPKRNPDLSGPNRIELDGKTYTFSVNRLWLSTCLHFELHYEMVLTSEDGNIVFSNTETKLGTNKTVYQNKKEGITLSSTTPMVTERAEKLTGDLDEMIDKQYVAILENPSLFNKELPDMEI